MPMLGNYNPYGDLQGGSYNPFDEGWYGVPDYGAGYNSYLQTQQQPLSLSQIVGMVREVQNGMDRSPVARLMSPVQQSEIPAQIAQNMMSDQNRLLSMPRRRMEESGANTLQQGGIEQDMNAPAGTAPAGRSPAGGGSAGGGFAGNRWSQGGASLRSPAGRSPAGGSAGGGSAGGGSAGRSTPSRGSGSGNYARTGYSGHMTNPNRF